MRIVFNNITLAVVDLGERPRGPHPPILGKKRKKAQKEEKLAGQTKQNCPPPP